MKSIGVLLGLSSLLLLVTQTVKLLLGSGSLDSADIMVVAATFSLLSTTVIAIGSVFNKG